jgi:hypothetical protein
MNKFPAPRWLAPLGGLILLPSAYALWLGFMAIAAPLFGGVPPDMSWGEMALIVLAALAGVFVGVVVMRLGAR